MCCTGLQLTGFIAAIMTVSVYVFCILCPAAKFTKRGHIVLRVRSVGREWTPPAPAGYHAIMLQPSYLPSSSADRWGKTGGGSHCALGMGGGWQGMLSVHDRQCRGMCAGCSCTVVDFIDPNLANVGGWSVFA